MRAARWARGLWPGLPQLWSEGDLHHFATALGFTLLLNFSLLTTFVWTGLTAPLLRDAAWLATAVFWFVGTLLNCGRARRETQNSEPEEASGWFPQAMEQYLRGNWLEAEILLERILARNARDVEARLLRATMFRRSGRHKESRKELSRLEALDGAEVWQQEIDRERAKLQAAQEESEIRADEAGEPDESFSQAA